MKKIILIALLLTSSVCSARGLFDWCDAPSSTYGYCFIEEREMTIGGFLEYSVVVQNSCRSQTTYTRYKKADALQTLDKLLRDGECKYIRK